MMTPGWPEPEVRARPAEPHEVPQACRSLAALATSTGWRVRVTYSRGTVPVASNRWEPGKVVDAVLLKAWRDGMGVVVSWEDGRTRSGWLLVPGMPPASINTISARALLKARVGE